MMKREACRHECVKKGKGSSEDEARLITLETVVSFVVPQHKLDIKAQRQLGRGSLYLIRSYKFAKAREAGETTLQ